MYSQRRSDDFEDKHHKALMVRTIEDAGLLDADTNYTTYKNIQYLHEDWYSHFRELLVTSLPTLSGDVVGLVVAYALEPCSVAECTNLSPPPFMVCATHRCGACDQTLNEKGMCPACLGREAERRKRKSKKCLQAFGLGVFEFVLAMVLHVIEGTLSAELSRQFQPCPGDVCCACPRFNTHWVNETACSINHQLVLTNFPSTLCSKVDTVRTLITTCAGVHMLFSLAFFTLVFCLEASSRCLEVLVRMFKASRVCAFFVVGVFVCASAWALTLSDQLRYAYAGVFVGVLDMCFLLMLYHYWGLLSCRRKGHRNGPKVRERVEQREVHVRV